MTKSETTAKDQNFIDLALRERKKIGFRISLRRLFLGETSASLHVATSKSKQKKAKSEKAIEARISQREKEERNREYVIQKLQELEGIGYVLSERLYDEFGSLEEIVNTDIERLMNVEGIGEDRLESLITDVEKLL